MLPLGRLRTSSAALALALNVAPLGVMLAVALGLARRHRRRAEAELALDPRAPLVDGPAVVFGKVDADGGDPDDTGGGGAEPVVTIRIHQAGKEWQSKGAWSHRWAETGRAVSARAFRLTRSDGTRVRVEPDEASVVIHDTMLVTERGRHAYASMRDRVAQVRAGDDVHAYGELRGALALGDRSAYREAHKDPVLRAPQGSPMVIAHEPAGDTEKKRARFHTRAAAALVLGLGLVVGLGWDYVRLVSTGQTVTVTPTHVATWQTWVKPKNQPGYWVTHHAVRGQTKLPGEPTAITLDDACSAELYDCVRAGACTGVPFVVAGGSGASVTGVGEAGLERDRVVGMVLLTLIAGLCYPIWAWSTRPWYVRKRLVESGSGRLLLSGP